MQMMVGGRARLVLSYLCTTPYDGQPQCKGRTGAGITFDRYAPAVQFSDLSHECQSQPRAGRIGVFNAGNAEKFFKNVSAMFLRDTIALVDNGDKNVVVSCLGSDHDLG